MRVGGMYHSHRAENPHRHRQIETGAFLTNIGGRKVDRHRLRRIAEAGVQQRGLDAFARFADCGIRHADGDEVARGAGGIHVDFNIDEVRVNTVNGGATGSKEGHVK